VALGGEGDDGAMEILLDADGLEGAVEGEGRGQGRGLLEDDVGEDGFLDFVGVVGTEADADVEGLFEMELDAGADLMERGVGRIGSGGEIQGEGVAAFFDAEAVRGSYVEFDAFGDSALGAAKLQRGQADAVLGRVDVGGGGVEGLANDEDGFAMRVVLAWSDGKGVGEVDVGGEGDVAGSFLPEEVEVSCPLGLVRVSESARGRV
jgi:hypothetical protein